VPDNLRGVRILRKMPFKWQANSQKILDTKLGRKQGLVRRNYSILLELRIEEIRLRPCPAGQDKRKTIPQSSKARAIRGRHTSWFGRKAKELWFINELLAYFKSVWSVAACYCFHSANLASRWSSYLNFARQPCRMVQKLKCRVFVGPRNMISSLNQWVVTCLSLQGQRLTAIFRSLQEAQQIPRAFTTKDH